MKIGLHISIGKGFAESPLLAKSLGAECMQIFTSNPRGWNFKIRTEEEIKLFRESVGDPQDFNVFGHMIYLCNLASNNPKIYESSVKSLISGLILSEEANFSGLVTHIGSHGGEGIETGTNKIVDAIKTALETVPGSIPILLETDSGSGHHIGSKFEEIATILDRVGSDRIGVCFDTCHTFAAGYDIRTERGLEDTLNNFEKNIGIQRLKLLHLNDSQGKLGSRTDRHAEIGGGEIGLNGFRSIVKCNLLSKIPAIIETPDIMTQTEGQPKSLRVLRSI